MSATATSEFSGPTTLSRNHRVTRVHVDCWSKPRRVIVDEGKVMLQVTLTCGHCDICGRRVSQIDQVVRSKPELLYRWDYVPNYEGYRWIVLSLPEGHDPFDFLREALGVRLQYA